MIDCRVDAASRRVDPTPLQGPEVVRLLDALQAGGEETRVVGGAVRNLLLDLPVMEIDFATTLLPDAVMAKVAACGLKAIPTGIEHGTITVVVAGTSFEVTTLRADVETDGRHAKVAFSRDFAHDAVRRDFTVNALSMTRDGAIHDYTGGLADLERRRIRFIGDPVQRIREDYLRVLRFFRFSAAYSNGPLDRGGLAAAIGERQGLLRLSRERVGAEMAKLLVARRAADVLVEMNDAGILDLLLAGVATPLRLQRACAIRMQDTIVHEAAASGATANDDTASNDTATNDTALDWVSRLAALAVTTVEDAARLHDVLRLSTRTSQRLHDAAAALVPLHATTTAPLPPALTHLLFVHGAEALGEALRLAHAESDAVVADPGWAAARRFVAATPRPKLPVGGADVVARGVPHGTAVGRILKAFQADWIRAGFPREPRTISELLDVSIAAEADL